MLPTKLEQLRGELVQLIEQQIETLAKQACEELAEEELRDYEERKRRIEELHNAIHHPVRAA
jgi:hypothetical protein